MKYQKLSKIVLLSVICFIRVEGNKSKKKTSTKLKFTTENRYEGELSITESVVYPSHNMNLFIWKVLFNMQYTYVMK